MTQTTTAQVFLKYDHPAGPYGKTSRCKTHGWIITTDPADSSQPEDPLDTACPDCGIEGKFDRKIYQRVGGESSGRTDLLPLELNPVDILRGYPAVSTNQGYDRTS